MITVRAKELILAICLSAFMAFISGCAGTASPVVDVKTAGDSVLNARESLILARSEGAEELVSQEFAQSEGFLAMAQEALEQGKSQKAAEFAFKANVEAKIAIAMAREAKASHRAGEIEEIKPKIAWETKIDEAAAAKTRQTIAEKIAREAEKEAERAKARADKQIQRSKAELAISKAELRIDSAEQAKAPGYAKESYDEAVFLLEAAKSALDDDDFVQAVAAAEAASRNATNASVQARAKLEAEFEESLRGRDKAVAAVTRAELSMEKAKEALTGQYAKDMYRKAEKLLEETRLALETREYGQAESLAEQANVSASSVLAVSEAEVRETQAREAHEDAQANALDAMAKAERSIAEAKDAGAEELAGDTLRKAEAALQRAKQAAENGDFEDAASLTQESHSHSITARTMSEAKTERLRKITEIENSIMEEAGKIPEVAVRKTNRGAVISMGGDLFAKGSSQIRSDAKARLKTVAEILKKYPDYKVVIEGHTDSAGSDEANLTISRERANNFLMHMVDQEKIPLERLSSVGYGESRPVASNINEDGRRQNRRVDIVILTAPVSP